MNRPVWVLLFALLAFAACKQEDKAATATPPPLPPATTPAAPAATTAAATAAAAPAATTAAPAAAVPGDVPTSEDYEQQALNEINPQNMEAELDKLEKDIAK